MLAIVEGGLAGWRGGVEGIEKKANLGIVGRESRALVGSLVLVTGREEYLSLRAALGTSTSESNTSEMFVFDFSCDCSTQWKFDLVYIDSCQDAKCGCFTSDFH